MTSSSSSNIVSDGSAGGDGKTTDDTILTLLLKIYKKISKKSYVFGNKGYVILDIHYRFEVKI